MHAREDANQKVKIMGITEAHVTSVNELMEVIEFGLSSRVTGSTAANSDSSRSLAILQIVDTLILKLYFKPLKYLLNMIMGKCLEKCPSSI